MTPTERKAEIKRLECRRIEINGNYLQIKAELEKLMSEEHVYQRSVRDKLETEWMLRNQVTPAQVAANAHLRNWMNYCLDHPTDKSDVLSSAPGAKILFALTNNAANAEALHELNHLLSEINGYKSHVVDLQDAVARLDSVKRAADELDKAIRILLQRSDIPLFTRTELVQARQIVDSKTRNYQAARCKVD